jgi:glycogen debranching enzyme
MTEEWAYGGGPHLSGAAGGRVTLVEGITFCICARSGDIRPGHEQGLFFSDTRFLSRFELEVNDAPLDPLVVHRAAPYSATFLARQPPRGGHADSTLLVVRRRYVGAGMLEEITVRNLGREAAGVSLTLNVDADFAGLFEVKEDRVRARGPVQRVSEDGSLALSYRRGSDSRGVKVNATTEPQTADEQLVWHAVVPPHDDWTTSIQVVPSMNSVDVRPRYLAGRPVETSEPATELRAWKLQAPMATTPDEELSGLLATSVEDLGGLRISDPESPTHSVVAAGAPWFMTLFGRDSLLAGWMLLPLDTGLALGTIQTLARLQGTKVDPLSEEEPGRILHEVRSGFDAQLALGGRNVYYGSVDATPLFVMLLGEAFRWGVNRDEVEELLGNADRAIAWIENYGDRDGDGFVEYRRATDRGLINQGWKDSVDGITFASGQLAEPPIALCEVQGYVYAAYRARAALARHFGDGDTSRYLLEKAADLKARFNDTFWLANRGYVALGLDGEKRPIDSLTSNMGHCLWTGILDADKAAQVASQLMGRDMFTGFGIRTLAASMGAYNPMSYHDGSVWPHDNAIAAAGLLRYGHLEAAQKVAEAIFDAGENFGGRLPELFCGFDRAEFTQPVPYPTSCYPQAWAAAAPLFLLRTLLRLDADVPSGRVSCAPIVPDRYLPLRVERLHLAGANVTCDVGRDGWLLDGLPQGFKVEEAATSVD